MHVRAYVYIYICVCVYICICVCVGMYLLAEEPDIVDISGAPDLKVSV